MLTPTLYHPRLCRPFSPPGHGYTNEELLSYRPTVCDNLVSSMMAVMKAMLKLRINLADQKNRTYVMAVLQASEDRTFEAHHSKTHKWLNLSSRYLLLSLAVSR